MRSLLLSLTISCSVFSTFAQSFHIVNDTVYHNTGGYYSILNNIVNTTDSNVILKWGVVATNFPVGLHASTCLCDNLGCNHDASFFLGGSYESVYSPGTGDMHLMGDITSLSEAGPFYITLGFVNKGKPADADSATFIINRVPLSLSFEQPAGGISLFPNPATGQVSLSVAVSNAGNANVSISDVTGRSLFRTSAAVKQGSNAVVIPLAGFAPGCYSVSVVADGHTSIRKLMVYQQ